MAQVDVWYTGKVGNIAQQIIIPANKGYSNSTYRQICFRLWGSGAGGQPGDGTTGSGNGGGGGAAVFAVVRVLNQTLTFNCSVYSTPAPSGHDGFYTVVRGPSLYLLADGGLTNGNGGKNSNSIATSNDPTYVATPNESLLYYMKYPGGNGAASSSTKAGGGGSAAYLGRPMVYPLDLPPIPPIGSPGVNGVQDIGGGAFAAALNFGLRSGNGGDGGYNTAVNTLLLHSFGYPGKYFGGGGGGGLAGGITHTYLPSLGGAGAAGNICVSYDLSQGDENDDQNQNQNQNWQTQVGYWINQNFNPNSNPMMFTAPFAIPGFGTAAPSVIPQTPVIPFYVVPPLAS